MTKHQSRREEFEEKFVSRHPFHPSSEVRVISSNIYPADILSFIETKIEKAKKEEKLSYMETLKIVRYELARYRCEKHKRLLKLMEQKYEILLEHLKEKITKEVK